MPASSPASSLSTTQEEHWDKEEEARLFDFMVECYVRHLRGELEELELDLLKGASFTWTAHVEEQLGISLQDKALIREAPGTVEETAEALKVIQLGRRMLTEGKAAVLERLNESINKLNTGRYVRIQAEEKGKLPPQELHVDSQRSVNTTHTAQRRAGQMLKPRLDEITI